MHANDEDEIIEVLKSDYEDMYSAGFWIGAIAGIFGTLLICLGVGLFIN